MATWREERPGVTEVGGRKRPAMLTIDVDCMHGHIEWTGFGRRMRQREERCIALSYQRWLPRFLDLLARHQVRATFFLVADFAAQPACRETVQRMVAEGHEIASHSLNHRIDLCTAPAAEQEWELFESRRLLEEISNSPVIGFRGPGYAISRRLLDQLLRQGYSYDSSVVPGLLFGVYKRLMWIFDRLFSGGAIQFPNQFRSRQRAPFIIARQGDKTMVELPINVLPLAPVPFVSFLMWNQARFDLLYGLVRRRVGLLNYQFHDFEFMDCDATQEFVPTEATRQIARASLAQRLALYDRAVARIKTDFEIVTAAEAAARERSRLTRA